jgi:hypothetical protein
MLLGYFDLGDSETTAIILTHCNKFDRLSIIGERAAPSLQFI